MSDTGGGVSVRQLLERLVEEYPPEGVDPQDFIEGTMHLVERRAEVFGRQPEREDLEVAASFFCWWPFKPDSDPELQAQLVQARGVAFDRWKGGFSTLDGMVPDQALRANRSQVFAAQAKGNLEKLGLRIPPGGTTASF